MLKTKSQFERVFTRRYHRRDVVIKLKINFNWQCDHKTGKTICFILLMFCVWISLHATMIFFFLSANLIKIIPCIRLYVCTYVHIILFSMFLRCVTFPIPFDLFWLDSNDLVMY